VQIRDFLMSLRRENASIEELAKKVLKKMDDEIVEENAAAELSSKIAKRFPNGAPPEEVTKAARYPLRLIILVYLSRA
jgi:hypothetical protein